jgi:hypothetical protein
MIRYALCYAALLFFNEIEQIIYLVHVIEQPIFRIPNLQYLQQNFVYLLDQQ